ncbi:MAG TPA: TIGR00282 family metallophosphoesterase [Proteobacteria bacterium]|nr:hypothetical protein BMS3Abin14_01324 [bacterium BMS3Abin14]HDL52464.1 TIGR00282 family metallophosphoesterase [Pseudomonadota bacterium]
MTNSGVKILVIGDVVGKPGRRAVRELLDGLIDTCRIDLTVANVENAAGGFGITYDSLTELFDAGVDVMTTGNHVWDKKEALNLLESAEYVLRPANYPPGVPGKGWCVARTPGGVEVAVLNISGRVFMSALDCPFRRADDFLEKDAPGIACTLVDFHAEATSEKRALSIYLDGRVSALFGTHTHVPTADERVLPGGTAYITDVGMTGNDEGSVIGIEYEAARCRFLTQMPSRFNLAKGIPTLNGAIITLDPGTGRALSIQRVAKSLDRSVSP